MMEWTYMILRIDVATDDTIKDSEKELDEMGAEGWEAVSVWCETSHGTFALLRHRK